MTISSAVAARIADAFAKNTLVLSEDEAKQLLGEFNIPVVREQRAGTPEQAGAIARDMGFPVVVKGYGNGLAHKSEMGLVKLNLDSSQAVKQAAAEIKTSGQGLVEGFLVQPMITGKRELVAGMFRDPNFGPVIMFGLGGIYTEALHDVSFRLAPLTDRDMDVMMDELSSKALLDDFRGEKKADRQAIRTVLSGLSSIALTLPDISEIDINPLIVTPQGGIVAVDALITLGKSRPVINTRPPVDRKILRSMFYPESIAFVGASDTLGKWGNILLTNALCGGYQGRIHLVNSKGGTIIGRHVHTSVQDIDDTVDLAIVTIPQKHVLSLLPQLKAKGIRGMLLITSGYSETGHGGAVLEKELVKAGEQAGVLILGPNTMGICNPHKQFYCTSAHSHPKPGSTALVSQSGNMGVQLMTFAEQQGIGIRAFSGSGNEAMVTVEDYMEVFEVDEVTKAVVMYIESVKDGQRFFKSAARVSRQKPVVVLKGGRTQAGAKAAASHTGAMASDTTVFNAACRQANIIQVSQPMELLDLSAVFSSLPLPRGNRVAILTLGGGWGVVTADLCNENGLVLPELSQDIIARLNTMLPDYWSKGNPVDIVGEYSPEIPRTVMEALLQWDGCDAVIHLGIDGKRIFGHKMVQFAMDVNPALNRAEMEPLKQVLVDLDKAFIDHVIQLTNTYDKPVVGVSLLTDASSKTLYEVDGLPYKGVLFPTPERAVKTLACMYRYAMNR
ncbi:MAG: acetate--CoA ligase family protein [Pseudomonadota bacterium]